MPLIYKYELDSTQDLLKILAGNLQKRRLEKGYSRSALSQLSGVPAPTIAKFETKHTISLGSFISLSKALDYTLQIKELLSEPKFSTMEEMERIKRNRNRKKGSKLKL